ncbi:hypothetical protein [Ktedonobacter robiniae]|uniref:Peptidase C39-like domain-containing protein n=1 Tax=Ktedonobacter robiniae TaxID=2778365 RepID=A0ABQ3USW5_9CHLR|nr:hypothetical protein [Ktedonobacter robiniae]GHO55793.1 hypothetical protein KSB_42680 [Ktedonobacter robiniae]
MRLQETRAQDAPRKKGISLSAAHEWRLIITFVMAFMMVSVAAQPQKAFAHTNAVSNKFMPAYSCGTVSSNHCYGVARWQGSVSGGFTSISVVQLHADASQAIMNNSLWIGNSAGSQWVEAGYAVIYTLGYEFWYWAYIDDAGGYHEYDSGGLASSDFGHQEHV